MYLEIPSEKIQMGNRILVDFIIATSIAIVGVLSLHVPNHYCHG
jgi:hypothetical protein